MGLTLESSRMTDRIKETETALLDAIRESSIYLRFEKSKEQINAYPEKRAVMDAFRKRNFHLQSSGQADLPEYADGLAAEKKRLVQDPVIREYLQAELAYCRMLQKLCGDIMMLTDLQLQDM